MKVEFRRISIGWGIVWLLAILGAVLILYRFAMGLGAVTNLSDGYPWGIWIGFDILAGIALAAGGFVMAGTVHLFGGRKFHALARPAVLTGFLGYLLFIGGLMVDLGRPWNLWKAMISWNHASPMFEVAWCVMMYTFVLFLEFLPAVFERFHLEKLHSWWKSLVPWLIVVMLGLFTLAMTYSVGWMLAMVIVLLLWEILMRAGIMPRDAQMPILLIMAGVIFSTLHQSSLGSLFLIMPHKLHALWFSPILPLLFFVSAVMVAPAMVIFESLMSERTLGHKARFDLLKELAKAMPYLLGLYLLLKVADLFVRGAMIEAIKFNAQAVSWWLEVSIGIVAPLVLFMSPAAKRSRGRLLWGSVLVVGGLIWNRTNVAVVGIIVREWKTYYPYWAEVFITLGLFSIGLILFSWAVKNLSVYEHEEASAA
ncbi:NrfD/PsrC family molybdoenzyme membrane anchor subunit [Nitrospinota bacterium]